MSEVTSKFVLALCSAALVLCSWACGSNTYGGGGYDPQLGLLYGVWFGSWSTTGDGANMVRLALTVDAYAQITLVQIDGAAVLDADGVTPTTGTLSPSTGPGEVYAFELTNGWVGGFYTDVPHEHAVLADEMGFGVLEKDAVSLPTYASGDVWDAGFVGYNVNVDDDFVFLVSLDSSAEVADDGQFSGSLGGGVSFVNVAATTLELTDAAFGVWGASYDVSPSAGSTQASALWFLSPDKQFVGVTALDDSVIGSSTPADLQISVWVRD